MQLTQFIDMHVPALERNEARHNLILGILGRAAREADHGLLSWTLGGPGACAIVMPGRPIILGELDREQCRTLAHAVRDLDHAGVVGPDPAPRWFVERAAELGHAFAEPIPQRIHALSAPPTYPGSPGHARQVTPDDAALLHDWTIAFILEAVPNDPKPAPEDIARAIGSARHSFWVLEGEPVAMATIARRTRNAAAISAVYTPPSRRRRGYAGSVTAAVAERVFAEGKAVACLYTDLRNPHSNRCYAKIGFRPVCDCSHHLRLANKP